jgi:hypothetical protein
MHTQRPRHHRKAGSGPAADALIAWIGTDPYLREAAALAFWRRVAAASPLSLTRYVRAAVVACCVLTGGAVLSMTTLNDERGEAQHKMAPPPLVDQSGAASGPTLSLTLSAQGESHPVPTISVPMMPRLATLADPPTSTAPVVNQRTVPVIAENQHNPQRYARPRTTGATAANKKLTGLVEPGDPNQHLNVDPRDKTKPVGDFGDGYQRAWGDSGELSIPAQTGNARSRPPLSARNLTTSADRNTPDKSSFAAGPVMDETTNGIVPTTPRRSPDDEPVVNAVGAPMFRVPPNALAHSTRPFGSGGGSTARVPGGLR